MIATAMTIVDVVKKIDVLILKKKELEASMKRFKVDDLVTLQQRFELEDLREWILKDDPTT